MRTKSWNVASQHERWSFPKQIPCSSRRSANDGKPKKLYVTVKLDIAYSVPPPLLVLLKPMQTVISYTLTHTGKHLPG